MKTLNVWGICAIAAPRSEVLISHVILWIWSFCRKNKFMVDGLLANLGVGIGSRFRSSLLATSLPVLSRTGFPPVALWFQEFSLMYQVCSMYQVPCIKSQALVAAQHPTKTWNDCQLTGTWDNFPLQIDSTSWNSLESSKWFTLSCNSCICEMSSCIVAWLSLNPFLENSSTRISWALFNSSISWIFLKPVSRTTFSRWANSSWSLACSFRDSSQPWLTLCISKRLEWACLWNSRMQLHTLASRFQILLLQVDDLFVLQELISQLLPDQRTWTKFHLFLELVDTIFCVRTLRQVSLHFLGSEMNLTLSFPWTNDKLVIGRHLLSLSPVSTAVKPANSAFAHHPNPIQEESQCSQQNHQSTSILVCERTCGRMRFSQRTEKHIQWMICAR